MNSQELFEKWYSGRRLNMTYSAALEVWNASRAAIEIELPPKRSEANTSGNFTHPSATAYDEAIDNCADVLNDAGITVKGE
ncbi:MAG: hypothetical protein QM578_12555 [Pantoea sp.]|uniref:hypothetical protein n=1 Tax=Pantoea sp. TaxID=69393 RepID=UPI0039E4F5E4